MNTKLSTALPESLIKKINSEDADLLSYLEEKFSWSHQQLKQAGQWLIDARMWREEPFIESFQKNVSTAEEKGLKGNFRQAGKWLFSFQRKEWDTLLSTPRTYPEKAERDFKPKYRYEKGEIKGNPFRLCPAASEKAVCLLTEGAVLSEAHGAEN